MLEGFKIITTRGESYVFQADPSQHKLDVELNVGSQLFLVMRDRDRVAMFPAKNVECVVRIPTIEGDLA